VGKKNMNERKVIRQNLRIWIVLTKVSWQEKNQNSNKTEDQNVLKNKSVNSYTRRGGLLGLGK